MARMAPRMGHRLVQRHCPAAVPAQDPRRDAALGERRQTLWRALASGGEHALRIWTLGDAGADQDAFPHPVRACRVLPLEDSMEVAAARRLRNDMGRSNKTTRLAHAAWRALGRRRLLAQSIVPVVAAAGRRGADSFYPTVGLYQPRIARPWPAQGAAVCDSRRIAAP